MGLTSIFVSHELEQTFAISDHVIILANGKVATEGTPEQASSLPANKHQVRTKMTPMGSAYV